MFGLNNTVHLTEKKKWEGREEMLCRSKTKLRKEKTHSTETKEDKDEFNHIFFFNS